MKFFLEVIKIRIVVDAMGGDNAPEEIVKGCILARNEYGTNIIFTGNERIIKKEIEKNSNNFNKIDIINADEIIENDEKPVMAIRRKKNSSLVKGLTTVKNNDGDAFLSAGSTGAILTGGLFILGRIPGIERPALALFLPTMNGFSLLIDAGANVDCKPEFLCQFAIMGSIYFEKVLKKPNATVGLANIGTEEGKGNKLVIDSYNLLKQTTVNFIGNVESRDIPKGMADVIVCDGFVGNTILKLTEGLAKEIMSELKNILTSSLKSKIGAALIKSSLKSFKARFDYNEYGGAPLIGVKAPVIKAHGSSNAIAIKNAVKQAKIYVESGVNDTIIEKIQKGG